MSMFSEFFRWRRRYYVARRYERIATKRNLTSRDVMFLVLGFLFLLYKILG